jgi:hypothetical protein
MRDFGGTQPSKHCVVQADWSPTDFEQIIGQNTRPDESENTGYDHHRGRYPLFYDPLSMAIRVKETIMDEKATKETQTVKMVHWSRRLGQQLRNLSFQKLRM